MTIPPRRRARLFYSAWNVRAHSHPSPSAPVDVGSYAWSAFELGHVRTRLRAIRNSMRPISSSHTSEIIRTRARTRSWMWARTHQARSSSGAFEDVSSLVRARASAAQPRATRNGMHPSSSSCTPKLVRTRGRTRPWMLARTTHRARSSSGAFEDVSSPERARAMHPSSSAPS